MQFTKISSPSKDVSLEVCHHADRIRDQLGSHLRLVDRIASVPASASQSQPISEMTIRTVIRLRRNRDRFFTADLFADPAWDILLELYLSEFSQQRVPTTSLCAAAAVPFTTALRWMKHLEKVGLICRHQDPTDGRRFFVSLTPDGRKRMDDYFSSVPNRAALI